jgi:hypothetical protein
MVPSWGRSSAKPIHTCHVFTRILIVHKDMQVITPCSRVLKKLIIIHLVKKLPVFWNWNVHCRLGRILPMWSIRTVESNPSPHTLFLGSVSTTHYPLKTPTHSVSTAGLSVCFQTQFITNMKHHYFRALVYLELQTFHIKIFIKFTKFKYYQR